MTDRVQTEGIQPDLVVYTYENDDNLFKLTEHIRHTLRSVSSLWSIYYLVVVLVLLVVLRLVLVLLLILLLVPTDLQVPPK